MTRRFLYTMGGVPLPEPVEVSEDFQSTPERGNIGIMVDRFMEGDRAQDGTDIGSRRKRADYMRAHGLADAGDFKEHWATAEAKRYTAKESAAQRHEAIQRAFHHLQQKGRK